MDADFVQKRPGDVQKLVDAWFDTLDYIAANPDESIAIMAKRAGVDVAAYRTYDAGTTIFEVAETSRRSPRHRPEAPRLRRPPDRRPSSSTPSWSTPPPTSRACSTPRSSPPGRPPVDPVTKIGVTRPVAARGGGRRGTGGAGPGPRLRRRPAGRGRRVGRASGCCGCGRRSRPGCGFRSAAISVLHPAPRVDGAEQHRGRQPAVPAVAGQGPAGARPAGVGRRAVVGRPGHAHPSHHRLRAGGGHLRAARPGHGHAAARRGPCSSR